MIQTGFLWNLTNVFNVKQLLAVVVVGCIARLVYNLKFHPLSQYPGPRIAAVTNLWWAYHSVRGKYPWVIEEALRRYGDVVRIAPNELVFLTPQAAKDIHLTQEKSLESFMLLGYDALDTGDGGIADEANPARHREVARKLAPAFSNKNLRAKETTIQKHINLFVDKISQHRTVELRHWSDWLALDLAADMTYSLEMGHVRDMRDSVFLNSSLKLNRFVTMSQVVRKVSFLTRLALTPIMYLSIPPSAWFALPKLISANANDLQKRIDRRGQTDHLDYVEQILPSDQPLPDKKQLYHLQNVAGQLLLASWQPLADQFYSIIFFLLKEPDCYASLVEEVRTEFFRDDDITLDNLSTGNLKYLQACVSEVLRLHPETVNGLPRMSPGAYVDGHYVPRGVICQISYFSATRSERFFHEPLRFRPERWLPLDHNRYDPKFGRDDLKASKPFSQGLRGCPGGSIATAIIRLYIAKIVWRFDLEMAQDDFSFDKHFKFLTFWEKPDFLVRMTPVERDQSTTDSVSS